MTHQNYADAERAELEHLLEEVSRSLDRVQARVVGDIDGQLDAVTSKGEELVSRLEAELSLLTERRATLEVQAINQDHIGFLQVETPPTSCSLSGLSVMWSSELRGRCGPSGRAPPRRGPGL